MAYEDRRAEHIRRVLNTRRNLSEKKMFGGLAFFLSGHMLRGVMGADLMARVGPNAREDALTHSHAREMDFTGRLLTGLVYVSACGLRNARQPTFWLNWGLAFVGSPPPK